MTADELAAENAARELHDDVPMRAESLSADERPVDHPGGGEADPRRGQSIAAPLPPDHPAALPDAGADRMRVSAPAGRPARRQPTRVKREVAATFACPACGAQPGEYCLRRNGRPRLSCHAERHAAALEHGAPGAQPRDTQLIPRQGGRVTRQGQPEAGARSA